MKNTTNKTLNGNGQVQLMIVGNSIRFKWVNVEQRMSKATSSLFLSKMIDKLRGPNYYIIKHKHMLHPHEQQQIMNHKQYQNHRRRTDSPPPPPPPPRTIRIYHECEGRIELSVPRIAFCHHEACRVMTNVDQEGRIFLSYSHTKNELFFLLTTVFIYFKISLQKSLNMLRCNIT